MYLELKTSLTSNVFRFGLNLDLVKVLFWVFSIRLIFKLEYNQSLRFKFKNQHDIIRSIGQGLNGPIAIRSI